MTGGDSELFGDWHPLNHGYTRDPLGWSWKHHSGDEFKNRQRGDPVPLCSAHIEFENVGEQSIRPAESTNDQLP